MTAKNKSTWLAAILLTSMCASTLRAQDYYSDVFGDSDLQFFSPVDFDFEDRPIGKESGFFFNYDKLSWATTGERTNLGTDGTSSGSFNPWRVFSSGSVVIPDPDDDGEFIVIPGVITSIAPPELPSSINSSAPRAEFAWGERYEFGTFKEDQGWLIGILDGPEAVSAQTFGFGREALDGTNGLLSPLGSVLIVFDDPLNLMRGFIDVVHGGINSVPGGALENDSNGDGVLDGDGNADDINRNGQYGPDGYDLETPGEFPDHLGGGLVPDFGDLVVLPTSFQTVNIRNTTELHGIEIMRTHRFDNRHKMVKKQGNTIEFAYGVRYLRLRDRYVVNGEGGVLGTSFWDTRVTNNVVGPQIALKWQHQRRRLRIDWGGRFLFGYNIENLEQTAALGQDLATGQHNKPLYFSPTYSNHGKQINDFSPVIEMRVQASYQVTGAVALKLGYTATFVDNIRRAAQQVKYELPSMGFRNGGTQDIFINGVNVGFDVVF